MPGHLGPSCLSRYFLSWFSSTVPAGGPLSPCQLLFCRPSLHENACETQHSQQQAQKCLFPDAAIWLYTEPSPFTSILLFLPTHTEYEARLCPTLPTYPTCRASHHTDLPSTYPTYVHTTLHIYITCKMYHMHTPHIYSHTQHIHPLTYTTKHTVRAHHTHHVLHM